MNPRASNALGNFVLTTADGTKLAATLVAPVEPGGIIVIASAMAVRRRLYFAFAKFAATQGFAVLVFDYRGVAESLTGPPRHSNVDLRDWGRQDIEAAIVHMSERFAGLPLYFLGHSVGGQVLPLAPSAAKFKAIALVGAQSGSWQHRPALFALALAAVWFVIMPSVIILFGFVPARLMGGTALPGSVARTWAHWGRHSEYIMADGETVRRAFDAIKAPVCAFSFSDDMLYAPPKSVDALLRWYGGKTQHTHLRPEDLGHKKIGHFGCFSSRFRTSLWPRVLEVFSA